MTDQHQTNAMADIMGKLSDVSNGKKVKTSSSDGDSTDAMASILRKLQEATNGAVNQVVTESNTNPELKVAVNSVKTETGVSISRYDIRTEKKIVQEGLKKTFYYIIDNRSGDIVHSDIGLFESAMGVVKHMLYTGNETKAQRILDLDQEYVGAMMETYGYKHRLTRLNESSVQYDVTSAKHSNCKNKLAAAKLKLLKAL